MNAESVAFLQAISAMPPIIHGDVEAVRERRKSLARLHGRGPDGPIASDERVGAVGVRRYLPPTTTPEATIVYVHGGGWIAGDVATHDGICRWLCQEGNATVVSVDYEQPPEAAYPTAVTQVAAVLAELSQEELSLPLTIAGDSSGAHIVVEAVSEHRRQSASRPVHRMLLIQPAADPLMTSESWKQLGSGYFLTTESMRWYWDTYLPHTGQALWEHDLADMPQTRIIVSEFDPSRDEGLALASHLARAGVPVEVDDLPGTLHGCLTMPAAFPSLHPILSSSARWLGAHASASTTGTHQEKDYQ